MSLLHDTESELGKEVNTAETQVVPIWKQTHLSYRPTDPLRPGQWEWLTAWLLMWLLPHGRVRKTYASRVSRSQHKQRVCLSLLRALQWAKRAKRGDNDRGKDQPTSKHRRFGHETWQTHWGNLPPLSRTCILVKTPWRWRCSRLRFSDPGNTEHTQARNKYMSENLGSAAEIDIWHEHVSHARGRRRCRFQVHNKSAWSSAAAAIRLW